MKSYKKYGNNKMLRKFNLLSPKEDKMKRITFYMKYLKDNYKRNSKIKPKFGAVPSKERRKCRLINTWLIVNAVNSHP